MDQPPTTPPAGWYDDPSDPMNSLRWWDGEQWTEHVHAKLPPQPTNPAPTAVPAVAQGTRVPSLLANTPDGTASAIDGQPGLSGMAVASLIVPIVFGPLGAVPGMILAVLVLNSVGNKWIVRTEGLASRPG